MNKAENLLASFLQEILTPIISESVRKSFQEFNRPNTDDSQKEYWDIKKTAEFLDLSKASIYRYTSSNQIPFHKRGKKLYFKKSDILAWLENGKNLTNEEYEEKAQSKLLKSRKRIVN